MHRPRLPRLVASLVLLALAAPAGAAQDPACPADGDGVRSPSAVAHYVEARLAGLRGDRRQEAEELRLAVAYDESSAELHAAYAEALLALGRIEAGETEARRALACDPTGRTSSESHQLLARILVARRQAEAALEELRAAMAIEAALAATGGHGDPAPWRLAAGVRVGEDDVDGAEAALEAAVVAVGSDGGGFRDLGRALLERGEAARAGRSLRRAVELDRGDLEGWGLLAQAEEAQGRRPEARAAWLALLRLDPDSLDALLGLGRLALLDADLAAGDEWLRRYLALAGDGPAPRARVAMAWLEGRRPEEALQAARQGLADGPADPRLLLVGGEALAELRRWRESAELLGRVTPAAGELWVSARTRMAWALSRDGRHEAALAALAPVLAARPRDPALIYARGMTLDEAGRPDQAEEQMWAVLAIDPDHAEALNFIGYRYAEQGVKLDQAEALLRRALRAAPRSGHIVDSLGWLRLRQGDVAGSVELLEQAERLVGPDAEVLDHLGDAYRAAGRPAEAVAAWRRALASLGDHPAAEQLRLRAVLEQKLSGVAASGATPSPR